MQTKMSSSRSNTPARCTSRMFDVAGAHGWLLREEHDNNIALAEFTVFDKPEMQ